MKYLKKFNESLKCRIDILEKTAELEEYITTALVDLLDMGFVLSLHDEYIAVQIRLIKPSSGKNLSGIKFSEIIDPIKSFIEYMINDYKMTGKVLIHYENFGYNNVPYTSKELIDISDIIDENFSNSFMNINNIYAVTFRVED